MDYGVLRSELTADPLARGYAGMTAAQVVADLNTAYRQRIRPTISSSELFEAIDAAEFTGLIAAKQARVDRLLGLGDGISTAAGSKARAEIVSVFGAGSATINALVASITESISRATELGLPPVGAHHVDYARSL